RRGRSCRRSPETVRFSNQVPATVQFCQHAVAAFLVGGSARLGFPIAVVQVLGEFLGNLSLGQSIELCCFNSVSNRFFPIRHNSSLKQLMISMVPGRLL